MQDHDFRRQLAQTETPRIQHTWEEFWKRKFPDTTHQEIIVGKCDLQLRGVDRILHQPNGKQFYVEEKTRLTDYGDFLIEAWSNLERRKPGWTVDPAKITDYLGYAIKPSGQCKLYNFPELRAAAISLLAEIKNRSPKRVINDHYTTVNYAVSWSEINRKYFDQFIQQVKGDQWGTT